MFSSVSLGSVGLLIVLVCLHESHLAGSSSLKQVEKEAAKKYLHEKLDSVDLDDEDASEDLFGEWASAHDLTFTDDSQLMDALTNWKQNAKKIKTHRKEHMQGKHSYQLALNQFSHISREEFRAKRLGYKNDNPTSPATRLEKQKKNKKQKRAAVSLPASVNWVTGGLVTSVKDQGYCGCCWAFSAAAVLEGAYAKVKGQLIDFSEEEFTDCAVPYVGCDGGVPATAIEFVAAQKGIATDLSYPYVAQDYVYNPTCNTATAVKIPMTPTYTWLYDDQSIQEAVAVQPVSVCIAVGDAFQFYESGVMNSTTACENFENINHAVLLVGYGTDPITNKPFWMFKNSWATEWGEAGYFRLNRDIPNSCGITVEAMSVSL